MTTNRAILLSESDLRALFKSIQELQQEHIEAKRLARIHESKPHHDPGQCDVCKRANAAVTLLWELLDEGEEV